MIPFSVSLLFAFAAHSAPPHSSSLPHSAPLLRPSPSPPQRGTSISTHRKFSMLFSFYGFLCSPLRLSLTHLLSLCLIIDMSSLSYTHYLVSVIAQVLLLTFEYLQVFCTSIMCLFVFCLCMSYLHNSIYWSVTLFISFIQQNYITWLRNTYMDGKIVLEKN